jgi:hypothetical protein
MRFHFLLALFFCLGIFSSCSEPNDRKIMQPKTSIAKPDTSSFTIITFDQNHDWPFEHTFQSAGLITNEIQQIDSLLKGGIINYNRRIAPTLRESYNIDFEKYKYNMQYMAVLNKKGEKEVWVNAFCDAGKKQWKTEIVLVQDGGNCFFNLKINLTKGYCFEISVNGYS